MAKQAISWSDYWGLMSAPDMSKKAKLALWKAIDTPSGEFIRWLMSRGADARRDVMAEMPPELLAWVGRQMKQTTRQNLAKG